MISRVRILFRLLVGIACVVTLNPPSTLGAQVQISFQLKDGVITLHEPAILLFKAHNASGGDVVLDLGFNKIEFFCLSLTTPQGVTLQNEPPYTEGFYPGGKVLIPAGGDYEQLLVLNQWFHLDSTGTYSLKAQLTAATVNGPDNLSPEPEYVPFEIKERNPDRLTKICSDLAEQVEVAPNWQAAQEAAILLSYVEDPIAIPYLSQILYAHKLVEKVAVSALERIGSEACVKVLISALGSEYGGTSDLARQALKRTLRKSSDPAVKKTIRDAGVN